MNCPKFSNTCQNRRSGTFVILKYAIFDFRKKLLESAERILKYWLNVSNHITVLNKRRQFSVTCTTFPRWGPRRKFDMSRPSLTHEYLMNAGKSGHERTKGVVNSRTSRRSFFSVWDCFGIDIFLLGRSGHIYLASMISTWVHLAYMRS